MKQRMLKRASENEIQRTDDNLESFAKRIVTYNSQTLPIVELFKKHGKIIELNAENPPHMIIEEFLNLDEFKF